MTPRSEMHTAGYVFGGDGVINSTGGWPTGIAFLLGLLSVQWTMTDYDASARECLLSKLHSPSLSRPLHSRHLVGNMHSKPLRPLPTESFVARRSSAPHMPVRDLVEYTVDPHLKLLDKAPAAIFIAVIGTGIFGWIFNITLILCSGPL